MQLWIKRFSPANVSEMITEYFTINSFLMTELCSGNFMKNEEYKPKKLVVNALASSALTFNVSANRSFPVRKVYLLTANPEQNVGIV